MNIPERAVMMPPADKIPAGIPRTQLRRKAGSANPPKRWRPFGSLRGAPNEGAFDRVYAVFPDGSHRRKGTKGEERRARKDKMRSIASHPTRMNDLGTAGRRNGRQAYAKGVVVNGVVINPHQHTEWRWADSKKARVAV